MGDAMVCRYWCYMCSQMVNLRPEVNRIRCPFCDGGFLKEMSGNNEIDVGSDRALSLWAPIFLRLMGRLAPPRVRIAAREHVASYNSEQEREFESFLRRRRSSSSSTALFSRMPEDIHSGITSQSEDTDMSDSFVLVDPINEEALIIQHNAARSLGEYLIGPGLDLLLQHFLENDPNRYGTPPAHKEVINAMPLVTVDKNLQCAVCLEDFDMGSEAKEMPCKHNFHNDCILPWLELHSSCPVCRFHLPSNDSKLEGNGSGNREEIIGNENAQNSLILRNGEERMGNGRRYWMPVPWHFYGLFSLSASHRGGSSSESAAAGAATAFPRQGTAAPAQRDEN